MNGDDRNDQFDELFEPFELSDTPPSGSPTPPPTPQREPQVHDERTAPASDTPPQPATQPAIACPSCGAKNPPFNHHCERCGSRLSSDPMPIASSPQSRASAGGRALGVLATVVLVVALVALMINIFGGDDSATTDTTISSTSATQPAIVTEIVPISVNASSQRGDAFGPENLIDGDPGTRWNDDALHGVGAWLEFTFAQPLQIQEIVFQNVTDDESFRRNYKIQGYTITVDDLNVPISGRLVNSNEPQRVNVASLGTTTLRIDVTTTHLAEPVGENPPFDELALQGVRFFGVQK
jgi:hypothetical protein